MNGSRMPVLSLPVHVRGLPLLGWSWLNLLIIGNSIVWDVLTIFPFNVNHKIINWLSVCV